MPKTTLVWFRLRRASAPARCAANPTARQPDSIRRVLMYESGAPHALGSRRRRRYVPVLPNNILLRKTIMHAKVSPLPVAFDVEDSTRPIRALTRGLDVLTALNRLERAAINTLAATVRLPRTTTYRILETLRLAGYVDRDAHDDCYRPTIMVRALSDGVHG